MTWRSERGPSDFDNQQGSGAFDSGNREQTMNDRANLSSAIWKRDSGCGSGGCSCGCCHGGTDQSGSIDPKALEAGVNQMSKILQRLGLVIDVPALWPALYPDNHGYPPNDGPGNVPGNPQGDSHYPPRDGLPNPSNDGKPYPSSDGMPYPSSDGNSNPTNDGSSFPNPIPSGDSSNPTDSTWRFKTITVSNGDQLTLGGMHGFSLVDKDGMPVTPVKTLDSGAMDAPVEHVLSNGAIYRSRGGWNHDESITWPNGDVVRFSDAGKFESYEPHQ
ncbi:MAG TPA: hypothetical protein V6C89_07510 [Drouetiella sp.]